MTMITPSYLGETIEYSSLHACRSTLEDPTPPSPGGESVQHAVTSAAMRVASIADVSLVNGPAAAGRYISVMA